MLYGYDLRNVYGVSLRVARSSFTSRFAPSKVLNASGQHPDPRLYRLAHEGAIVLSARVVNMLNQEIVAFKFLQPTVSL